jgi:hypothetical protein
VTGRPPIGGRSGAELGRHGLVTLVLAGWSGTDTGGLLSRDVGNDNRLAASMRTTAGTVKRPVPAHL